MSRNYIGKTCPYCKTPLTEGDTVVVCGVCDMPHHLSCWQDNRGCTTFGCTGSIKEIIEAKTERTTAPVAPAAPAPAAAPVRPAPSQATSAPKQVTQSEKPIETLYDAGELVFLSDLPVAMENTAIIIDRTKDKLFARCVFRSLTDKPVSAMLVEIACQDVWGNPLGEPVQFQYLDLKTKMDTKFGQTSPIELPDKTTRKIKVSVEKVLFADGTVATGGDVAFTMPAPVHLRERLGSDALAAEYARETSPKAQFVLETANGYWRCACGALNTEAEENCHNCGCTMEQLAAALDPEKLNANLVKREEAKRAAEEKAKAEQEERIRQAEEQARQEKNRKEHKARVEAILEQRKKRRKKTGIAIGVSLVVVVLIVCGVVFFGIPYSRYQQACDALDNKQYNLAFNMFNMLDGFLDSEEMATETRYQEACDYQEKRHYVIAISIFEDISYYKNSEKKILECKYGYVVDHKNNDDRTTYEFLLTLKSENYKDSATIYTELYKWRVTGIISRDSDNYTKHEAAISKYSKYLHCWFVLTGGTPGETITVTHTTILPDGDVSVASWHWEDKQDGSEFGAEWDGGLYTYPQYGDTGTLTIKVYNQDTGELLGTVSTRITS